MPLSQQTKKGIYCVGGVTDLDLQGEIGLLLQNGSKVPYVQSTENPLGFVLVLPGSATKISGKQQQHNPGRMLNGPEPSGMGL